MSVTMEKLTSLCKRRGFIFPGSEIYGGLANSWDYGPLGAQMKKNIKNDWWKNIVEMRDDIVGLDGAILMNPRVWEASGHVETFKDPLVECKKCHKRYRLDDGSIMPEDEWNKYTQLSKDKEMPDMVRVLKKAKCASCGETGKFSKPKFFNLMFETSIGKTDDEKDKIYLRPETAQAIFVNFKNVLDSTRVKLPFGIAQIGKAFRNEITPGNFIFRTLEFEQMELEYFMEESMWEEKFAELESWMENWAASIGIDASKLHKFDVPKNKLAHYSKRTVDFEFDFPFGTKELWGLAYRTDFDLKNHEKHSGQKLEYADPEDNKKKIVPNVVEPSFGVDRTLLAILASAYHEEEVNGETRVVMKFAPKMAPYHVAVLPLMKKDGLAEKAKDVFLELLKNFRCEYDVSGAIGRRYRRQDEIGTPFCITVDYDTFKDNTVTVRHRDSMEQKRVDINDLVNVINKNI
jgi:glycyl-tRNA synthetase